MKKPWDVAPTVWNCFCVDRGWAYEGMDWSYELIARKKYEDNKTIQTQYDWYLKGFMAGGCS